jgi:hypothetical protein
MKCLISFVDVHFLVYLIILVFLYRQYVAFTEVLYNLYLVTIV